MHNFIPQDSGIKVYQRQKSVRRSVVWMDKVMSGLITTGGILVILAVLGIMLFLVVETAPLFRPGKQIRQQQLASTNLEASHALLSDEYKSMLMLLTDTGQLEVRHIATDTKISSEQLTLHNKQAVSLSQSTRGDSFLFGFADGNAQIVTSTWKRQIIGTAELPPGAKQFSNGDFLHGKSVYSRIPGDLYRKIQLEQEVRVVKKALPGGEAVVKSHIQGTDAGHYAFLVAGKRGQVYLHTMTTHSHMMSGESTVKHEAAKLAEGNGENIFALMISDDLRFAYVVEKQGLLRRFDISDPSQPRLAEKARLFNDSQTVTSFTSLLGGNTLLAGSSSGHLLGFFLLERPNSGTPDGRQITVTRTYRSSGSPVINLMRSQVDQSFAQVREDGSIEITHGTSQKTLFSLGPDERAWQTMQLAPRLDAIYAMDSKEKTFVWEFEVFHPETTFRTLFLPVWYEGYPQPTLTWQSSAATDDFEPKLSLTPLIFGTLKATFYSLLFAVPLALFAAICTSEFLTPKSRSVIKPIMETMASLPSVVLGFVAALVLAPFVESWISAVMMCFLVVPLTLMGAAYAWQAIPQRYTLMIPDSAKLAIQAMLVIVGITLATVGGTLIERAFFAGDFKSWLNGTLVSHQTFTFLLSLPVSFFIIVLTINRLFGHQLSQFSHQRPRFQAAAIDMARWVLTLSLSLCCSFLFSWLLHVIGLDPRGGLVDTYVQRNSLIVGFAMGFAVIPIIYTLAEDALNAVPNHLRAASLSCGASPWQMATTIVLPTALSGVFSAVMIGMGRAVGETMIVVMAAGNTPLMDINIFNGLRALSATIAVELPEAVKGGTLYRVLFLSGLVLFAMTFLINTVAEIVRLRFRKRAAQL